MPSEPTPIQRYLRVERRMDRELATILKDAAREASKTIEELAAKPGVGAAARRAQLTQIRRELLQQSEALWGRGVTPAMRRYGLEAARAANESMDWEDRFLRRALGDIDISEYQRAQMLQSTRTIDQLMARSVSGRPLSDQIYKTKALSDKLVDRAVNRGLLQGKSARELAKDVRTLIRPDAPGGVSYAAHRLARTEINNAFHQTHIDRRSREPWAEGMRWNLSGSHDKNDDCDSFAGDVHFRGGAPGVYRPEEVPGKPHPNCLCFVTTETVTPEQFIEGFMRGDYREFMREEIASQGMVPDF